MRLRLPLAAAFAAVIAAFAVTAATATAAPARGGITTAPITATQAGNVVQGAIQIANFAVNSAGQLVANGTFTGTLTDVNGVVHQVTDAVTNVAVTNQATGGGCQILDLVLGPLDLNLLGLVVHLDTVHLNITAQPGPGNLLGNLLCSVAGLLDNGNVAGLNNLLNLLNQLLGGL
jgi:hypothetical protein